MSEISGSVDLQPGRLEPVSAEFLVGQPTEETIEKVTSGYGQTNAVSQSQTSKAYDYLASRVIPVPTLQPALQGATVTSSGEIKGLLAKALMTRDSLRQPPREQTTFDSHAPGTGNDTNHQLSAVGASTSTPLQGMLATVQSALSEASDSAEVTGVYESNVKQLANSIQQTVGAELSAPLQALSVVASNISPSIANSGSLALQRVIDDIVSISRNSGGTSGNEAKVVQQSRAVLFGSQEHVRLGWLSQRLGVDLEPLIRNREEFLEGILVIQRGILLSIEAMSNAEFLEILKERLREERVKEGQIKEDQKENQNKETVEKLKQAIAAIKGGEPKVAAETLNSASLITTAIEQIVDRYTSDETPGSLRQHLKEQLTLVLNSVTRQGSYQDMMNKRVELLHSAKKV